MFKNMEGKKEPSSNCGHMKIVIFTIKIITVNETKLIRFFSNNLKKKIRRELLYR